MIHSWKQPSLSRDFALLAAGIVLLLLLISTWIAYATYHTYSDRIETDLQKESQRVERMLNAEMENVNYMLMSLGKHIVVGNDRSLVSLAQTLKSFDSRNHLYSIFSWITPDERLAVSSNKGVLDKPVDVSDRDYIQQSAAEPWKMHIGRPIEGRVSERWVIPAAMGITDNTGKFIGSIMISLDIDLLTEHMKNLMRREGMSYAIVSQTLIPLTQVSEEKDFATRVFPIGELGGGATLPGASGFLKHDNPFWGSGSYFYYRAAAAYPYVILLGYNARYNDALTRNTLWIRLLEILSIVLFFTLFLWIMRARMIKPLIAITADVADVANGRYYRREAARGPEEIQGLRLQVNRVNDYIDECKRIEDELRNKVFMLKKAKEKVEMAQRGKSEFFAYACQEIRTSLNQLVGDAQAMRDQIHGPIENRKYRQYADEIYGTGNTLLGYTQDLLTLAKAETGYLTLAEKPVDVPSAIGRTLTFLAERMQADGRRVDVTLQEPLPKLIADEFRFQQILANALLHVFRHAPAGAPITLDARVVGESRERLYYALTVASDGQPTPPAMELFAWAERLSASGGERMPKENNATPAEMHIELVKSLMALHQGAAGETYTDRALIALFFPPPRVYFSDEGRI